MVMINAPNGNEKRVHRKDLWLNLNAALHLDKLMF